MNGWHKSQADCNDNVDFNNNWGFAMYAKIKSNKFADIGIISDNPFQFFLTVFAMLYTLRMKSAHECTFVMCMEICRLNFPIVFMCS